MEKLTPKQAVKLSKNIGRSTYLSNPFYLEANCFWDKENGEVIVYEKDITDGKIKPLFLPKKVENMRGQSISAAFDEDLNRLQELGLSIKKQVFFGNEYVYKTVDFIQMQGSRFKPFRNAVTRFEKGYQFNLVKEYPHDKIVSFLKKWVNQKSTNSKSEITQQSFEEDLAACIRALDILNEIPHKKIFIEIDGQLAGFNIFLPLHNNLWVYLMQKTNYTYKGLDKFLYHLAASEMKETEFFTTGAGAQDPSLIAFKESLNPIMKLPIYVLELGN